MFNIKVKSMSYISIVKTYSFTGEQHIFITNNSKSMSWVNISHQK